MANTKKTEHMRNMIVNSGKRFLLHWGENGVASVPRTLALDAHT